MIDCYVMVNSGSNAIIVPLHPGMCGEIAECKVPSLRLKGQQGLVDTHCQVQAIFESSDSVYL